MITDLDIESLSGVEGLEENFFLFQKDNLLEFNENNDIIQLDFSINEELAPNFPNNFHLTFHSENEVKDLLLVLKEEREEEGIIIFFSYSLEPNIIYPIREIAEKLSSYDDVSSVLFYEEHTIDNFVKYMEVYIGKCDILLLFCSEKALKSRYVIDEWSAVYALGKPIVPIFIDLDYVPNICRPMKGHHYYSGNIEKNVSEIYKIIKKKLSGTLK